MSVTKRTRFEVLRRDGYTCRYCRSSENPLTVDHVTPVALGGGDDPSNLVAACRDCNTGKASAAPDAVTIDDVSRDALRWAAAIREAAYRQLVAKQPIMDAQEAVEKHWARYKQGSIPRPANWWLSVEQWCVAGLDQWAILESIDIAMVNAQIRDKDVWRYACGVAWTKLRKLTDDAEALIAEGVC